MLVTKGTDTRPPAAIAMVQRRWRRRRHRDRALWMLTPTAVAITVIVLIPVALTLVLSVLDVNLTTLREWLGAPWAGLANYKNAFTIPSINGVTLGDSIWISFAFSVGSTLVATPIGLLAALSVHRRFRGSGLVRALYLIPYVIPTFVVALMARLIFLSHDGLFDVIFSKIGLTGRDTYWLTGSHAFWAMLMTEIWAAWPFMYLMVLAGLQAIPRELYEAAVLDGAGIYQRVRYIVMPGISRVLLLGVLLSTVFHFSNFTLAFVMFTQPPPTSVQVLPINIYFNAFSSFDYGVACAMAIVTIVILLIPGYLYLRATKLAEPA